ncbi:MAG TPA: hypothetical protein VII07_10245, partial [Bradyrhizobium sp.]
KATESERGGQAETAAPASAIYAKEDNPHAPGHSRDASQTGERNHTLLEKIAFGVAVLAAAGTGYQAYVANDAEMRTLRAYIGLSDPAIEKIENVWTIEAMNGGQTPARNVAGHLNMAWKEGDKAVPKDFSFMDYPGSVGDFASVTNILPQKSGKLKFALRNLDIIEKSKAGDVLLIVYGHIDYDDIFGKRRTCEFAYYSVPSSLEFGRHIKLARHNDCN